MFFGIWDPGWEKIRIRDKRPGSATLGLGLICWQWRTWRHLLSPQESDHEFGPLPGGFEGPSAGRDWPLWMHALSPGWRPVPCIESDQGISGPAELPDHGLAGQFTRPESYWKLLEPDEAEAEGCGHLLPAQAEGGPPEAVDPGPQQGLPCFPQCLNAQEDCCRHQEWRRHDQVLDKAIVFVFFQKYICFFKLARFLFPKNMCF